MTTAEEYKILAKFQELYSQFPSGEIIKSESPDFIIKSQNIITGIEITEAFQDPKLQQSSSEWSALVDELINRIQQQIPFTFSISVHFNNQHYIKKSKKELLYKLLIPHCLRALSNLYNKERVTLTEFDGLPIEIDEISICRYEGLQASYNHKSEGGWVSNFTDTELVEIIEKKNLSFQKYAKCNEHWLIIKEGNYYAGTFNDVIINKQISTPFNKVFLLRFQKQELIVLK